MIQISQPVIGRSEINRVIAILKSGKLAQGNEVKKFEQEFANYCSSYYALATSSGTAALHLALLASGIRERDEIITPAFGFPAAVQILNLIGAVPIFVDIDEKTFTIDPEKIEPTITKRTKAILPVHLFGLPADMGAITWIAKRHQLKIIEDAAQAHGAAIGKKKMGTFGIGCFSFYATKNMTTGEGGMVTLNDKRVYELIKKLRNDFSYRMTEMSAAIGRIQLRSLDERNKKRIENASFLTQHLQKYYPCPQVPPGYTHVFHQYTLRSPERNRCLAALHNNQIEAMVYYPTTMAKLPVARCIAQQVFSIPVHPYLSKKNLHEIVMTLTNR